MNFKKIFIFLALSLCSVLALPAKNLPETILILNMDNEAVLPKKFRTTQDAFEGETKQSVSRLGFDQLRISGSAQFSDKALTAIIERLNNPKNLYILDLRQESHGFINGAAVSWYGVKDWANVGKTLRQIEEEEQTLLKNILTAKTANIALTFVKEPEGQSLPIIEKSVRVDVKDVATENQLVNKHQATYIRFPVTDHVMPTNEIVDQFVYLIKQMPQDRWIHMHCAAGIGRTSTFMVMLDMMKNAKQVSYSDILERQLLIGGRDLRKPSKSQWKAKAIADRTRFLEEFYDYCRTNQDNYQTPWSLYRLLKD